MKTPNGQECHFFFGDYYRGRSFEECRLLTDQRSKKLWDSKFCKNCPVPAINQSNACEYMQLTAKLKKALLFFKNIEVIAYCTKVKKEVREPKIGCGECHPIPEIFKVK